MPSIFLPGTPPTRLISTTAPLSGGGDLTADLTLGFDGSGLQLEDLGAQAIVVGAPLVADGADGATFAPNHQVTNLEAVPHTVQVGLTPVAPSLGLSDERAAFYHRVMTAAPNEPAHGIYLETDPTNAEQSTAIKIIHQGLNDAIFIASFRGAPSIETASFCNGTTGCISTVQWEGTDTNARDFGNSTCFNAVWGDDGTGGSRTPPNYAVFLASRSLGHSYRTQLQDPTAIGFAWGRVEHAISSFDYSRYFYELSNIGQLSVRSRVADNGNPTFNDSFLRVASSWWNGVFSQNQSVKIYCDASAGAADLVVLTGPEGSEAETLAVRTNNVLIGKGATAGVNSVAVGYNADALTTSGNATAIGYGATCGTAGFRSVAIGNAAQSNQQDTVACGAQSLATSLFSTACGAYAYGQGNYAVAVGYAALSNAAGATSLGASAQAKAINAVAIGYTAVANAVGDFALGATASASGGSTIAIGIGAVTGGGQSVAVGLNASAAFGYSIGVGSGAIAGNAYATAIGQAANCTGDSAIAFGRGAAVTFADSIAIGRAATASNQGAVVVGPAASASGLNAIAIGGTSPILGDNAIGIGYVAQAGSANSIAIGNDARATVGSAGVAIGTVTRATNTAAVALGSNASATGAYGVSLGGYTNANTNYSIAIGYAALANQQHSIALGASATATAQSRLTVGRVNTADVDKYKDVEVSGDLRVQGVAAINSQMLSVKAASTLLSALSGATATFTGAVPAGAIIIGATTRVTTAITGATGYDIGDGTDQDRWGANIAPALGTVSTGVNWTDQAIKNEPVAVNVVLTAVGGNFTAGAVRVTIHYILAEAAAS